MKNYLVKTYKKIAAQKIFLPLNNFLFNLSLRGLGILNYENSQISGEDFLLKKISEKINPLLVLDIGANRGEYSKKIKFFSSDAKVYAFEPHPISFKNLESDSSKYQYIPINLGCSDVEGKLKLYDYKRAEDNYIYSHASLYKDVIEKIHNEESRVWEIDITTVDKFCLENNINRINLLKIDTEGNEFKILLGAKNMIQNNAIDCIHFEFNEMNIISRVFLKDFYDLLPQYDFYRLITDGFINLGSYKPLSWEIFAYQNIIAIRKELKDKFKNIIC